MIERENLKEVISKEELSSRIAEIGAEISSAYNLESVVFIVVLNGSFIFASDLIRAVDIECEVDFIKVTSYSGMKSEGKINFEKDIPFKLTNSQKKVINEIFSDMKKSSPMKRLLQGDVGSGKTIVAAAAVYAAINSSHQAVLMAPTEVLAEQHFHSLSKILIFNDVQIYLLTSSVTDRDKIMKTIKDGTPALIIGTHALIQDKVKFNNLGLAIIDEQQRFGVEQRKKLTSTQEKTPHQLVMTATPIPRTTALAIYGDLDLSVIDEMPPGRKTIKSILYEGTKEDTEKIYTLCENHLKNKSQKIEKDIYKLAGKEFNIGSPKQLQEIFFDTLGIPIIRKTPKGQPSTSEDVLQELSQNYEIAKLVLQFRNLMKLINTYTDRLGQQINNKTGRLHTSYHQAVTITGRLSSSDPNLQNIPIRSDDGKKIRSAFIAEKKCKIVSADYSQIELRVMAHLSKDKNLTKNFLNNEDVHASTAKEIFNIDSKPDDEQRRYAKTINFGLIYGCLLYTSPSPRDS